MTNTTGARPLTERRRVVAGVEIHPLTRSVWISIPAHFYHEDRHAAEAEALESGAKKLPARWRYNPWKSVKTARAIANAILAAATEIERGAR
ncbi:MAG: hypothetical protein KGI98_15630 [Euryarchaeota archaeon]|nr:hypothetical protein [Euryarchaeota archaeon]